MPRNDSIEKVLMEYQTRKINFQVKYDEIIGNLLKKYPSLIDLRQKYASLKVNQRKFKNDENYNNKIIKTKARYEAMLADCLKMENINPKELEYIPICTICNDTGYVGNNEKKYCTCLISKAAQIVLENSNINARETLENSDMEIFDDSRKVLDGVTQRGLMKRLFRYITNWTTNFPKNEKKQIIIIGNVGLGKSYLLNAIAYEIIKKGFSAMLVSSFAINEAVFDEIKKSDSTALNMMRSVDVLLIDDLGGEQVLNNITCPTLLNILNERTRRNLHTVVSTNLNRDRLEEKYDTRIVSRLFDKGRTFVPPILGEDIRKKRQH